MSHFFLSRGKAVLALGRALTENHGGFLKGLIPQKTKPCSPVRQKHGSCGALEKLEARSCVPKCTDERVAYGGTSLPQHRAPQPLCALPAWALGAPALRQELPAGDQQYICHGLGTPAVCKSRACAHVGERECFSRPVLLLRLGSPFLTCL